MHRLTAALSASGGILIFASTLAAQSTVTSNPARLFNISGVLRPADGQPLTPVELVTVAIYADESGGTALWQDTQTVTTDGAGRYTLLLGATLPEGVPPDLFASGEARWIGITLLRPGESEGLRVRLTSVPYALQASNAEALGGRPASAYLLAPTASSDSMTRAAAPAAAGAGDAIRDVVTPGTIESTTSRGMARRSSTERSTS